jgi:hypothetical protein
MPRDVRNSSLEEIQAHEMATGANVRLGGYGMDGHWPLAEVICMHVTLSGCDLERLFVLPDFKGCTWNHSCQLVDINDSALAVAMERQAAKATNDLDLTVRSQLELVLVGIDVSHGPLVTVDGNHRLLAHYTRHRSIDGVPAYVGIHPNMHNWPFVPPLARHSARTSRCMGAARSGGFTGDNQSSPRRD